MVEIRQYGANMLKALGIIACVAIVSIFVSLVVITPVKAYAISQSEVQSELQTIRDQWEWRYWTSNGKPTDSNGTNSLQHSGKQCSGFAKWVYYQLFDIYSIGTTYNGAGTWYRAAMNLSRGSSLVDQVASTNASSVEAAFRNAAPGDFVQMRRSHGGPHSQIVYSVSTSDVTVIECNTDNACGVYVHTFTWGEYASKNAAFSIYRADAYDPTPGPDNSFIGWIEAPSDDPTVEGNLVAHGWAREGNTAPNKVVYQVNGPGPAEHVAQVDSARTDVPSGCAWRAEISSREFHVGNNYVTFAAEFDDGRHDLGTRGFYYSPADSEKPVISNIKVDSITPDGYRVTCKATDNIGVTAVEFPTWTSANGQDDMTWWEGTKSGDTYTFNVKVSDHGNQSGPYNTHIYARDAKGNETWVSAAAGLLVPKAMANLGNSTYFLMDDAGLTWQQAEQRCEWAYGGGYLVNIGSQEEQDVLNKLVASGGMKHYWIGASDAAAEGEWKWTSGGTVKDVYENWASGEPDGGTKENYAALRKADLKWIDDDDDGGSSYGYIMEVEDFHGHNGTVTTDLPEGIYTINASSNEGYVFDIAGNSMESKANLQLNSANGGDNQRFKFTLNGDGTYTIAAVHSGLVLDVYAAALNEDANVIQYSANGTAAQRWYLEVNDDGYYSFRSKVNNLYLDVRYNDMADGTNIRTHTANASAGQKFSIKRADDPKVTKSELLDVTPDGYKVRVEIDAPQGIQRVRFPSWPISKGSDVAIWDTVPVVDNVAEYEVKVSNYDNLRGVYCTHVYVTDSFGKSHRVESFDNVIVPTAVASWSDSTYFLVDDLKSVADAKGIASSQPRMKCTDSHLAVIESAEEQAVIDGLLASGKYSSYWIGASDASREGSWVWDTGAAVDYANWVSGEPNGGTTENFAAADRSTGEWRDHNGTSSNKWGFIVEYEGDDRVGPTVSDVTVSSIDETGYTLQFKAADPSGVDTVKVGAWSEAEGESDLVEKEPLHSDKDGFTFRVSSADHGNVGGTYLSRVVATDSLGNKSVIDLGEEGKATVPDAAVDTGYAVYYRFDQPMTWTEARTYAESKFAEGMKLASVLSESDDDYIASLLAGGQKAAYWLGLSRDSGANSFIWEDGSDLDYTHWAAGQPGSSDSARYAAVLASNQKWYAYADSGVGGKTANMGFIAKIAYPSDEEESCDGDHVWTTWETVNEPTCTKAGLASRYCERCGESETRELAKISHSAANAVVENEQAATCSQEGHYESVVYCAVCGEEMSRSAHVIPKVDHTWDQGSVTREPSCEQTGERAFTCAVCGERKTEEIAATGHKPGAAKVENQTSASTCDEGGSYDEVVYCSVCGKELSRERKTTPAGEHSPIVDAAVAPTCTEVGLTEGSHCIVCGKILVEQQIVPTLGHKEVAVEEVSASCTEPGVTAGVKCDRCGMVLSGIEPVEALGHDYREKVVAPSCTEAGHTHHACSRCDDSYDDSPVAALGHFAGNPQFENEVAPTCTQDGSRDLVVRCATCGEELGRTTSAIRSIGHIWSRQEVLLAPTCTTAGVRILTCEACGQTKAEVIAATGHVHVSWSQENEVDATCTENGGHDDVVRCDDCGAELSRLTVTVDALGHDYATSVVEPTWDEAGYTLHTCIRCGDSYKTDEVASLKDRALESEALKVADAIAALPSSDVVKLDDSEKVRAVRAAYDALNKAQRAMVDVSALEAVEARIATLEKAAAEEAAKAYKMGNATVNVTNPTYSGKALTPTVTVKMGSKKLVKGTDYVIAYKDKNGKSIKASAVKAVGSYKVVVTGAGSYSGSVEKAFKVVAAKLSSAKVTASSPTYTGKAIAPTVTVKAGTTTLKNGTDYTVAYKNSKGKAIKASAVKAAGSYKVVLTGKANYTGSVEKAFKVNQAKITAATFSKIATQTITKAGKAVTPGVTVKYKGVTLKKGTDYTLTYKNNKKAGTATVAVKGKGSFTGSKSVNFKIAAKKAKKTASGLKAASIG